jgi:hypothetical protein
VVRTSKSSSTLFVPERQPQSAPNLNPPSSILNPPTPILPAHRPSHRVSSLAPPQLTRPYSVSSQKKHGSFDFLRHGTLRCGKIPDYSPGRAQAQAQAQRYGRDNRISTHSRCGRSSIPCRQINELHANKVRTGRTPVRLHRHRTCFFFHDATPCFVSH